MDKPIKKKDLSNEILRYFLSDISQSQSKSKIHYDTKANWIMGISAAITALLLPDILNAWRNHNYSTIIIFFSALITLLISIIIISPPSFLKNKTRQSSLMYNQTFSNLSATEFKEKIKNLDKDTLVENYVNDIINFYNNSLKFKANMTRIPYYILFSGLILGMLALFLQM